MEEKIKLQYASLQDRNDFEANREKEDLLGLAENIGSIVYFSQNDPNFDVLDFISKTEKHKIDIGPLADELEWDLFDQIRVSNQIPYVVLNIDSVKVEGIKGQYRSTPQNRKFKVYSEAPLENWIEETNIPFSLIMKVLVKPKTLFEPQKALNPEIEVDQDLFSKQAFEKNSYVDVIYNFDKVSENGLFIKFQKQYGEDIVDSIIEILQSHITGFDVKFKRLTSIAGSFVIDRLLVDPVLFRQLLINSYKLKIDPQTLKEIPAERSFTPIAFLWPNENLKGLSMRKRFILKFKLGNIEAKVSISRKLAKTNDVFYTKGAPVTFRKGAEYELVKISDVASLEDAQIVKDFVSSLFYLYGQAVQAVKMNQMGQEVLITTTRSFELAELFNLFIYARPDGYYAGSFFLESNKIMSKDLADVKKVIERLRKIDPSFYGSIPTGKLVGRRQPIPIVKTDDPNWQTILWQKLLETEYVHRQIIRYPFEVYDINGESIGDEIETKVPPYFLITSEEAPFFQLRNNENPIGSNGSVHPYIIQCAKKQYVETPGQDIQGKYQALIEGVAEGRPFHLTLLKKSKGVSTGDYTKKTLKILTSEYDSGGIPSNLEKIFLDAYFGKQNLDLSELIREDKYKFRRVYAPRIPESILHLLSVYGGRKDLTELYLNKIQDPDKKINFLKSVLKTYVAKNVDWNVARQELYDMDPIQIRQYFLSPNVFVDPQLFKAVLEQVFNVFLLVFSFDGKKLRLEIPRHKFLHISKNLYSANTIPLVILKHETFTSSRVNFPHCEAIFMYNENGQVVPWNLNHLKEIFNKANKTVDINFYDAHHIRSDTFLTAPTYSPEANLKPDLTEIFVPEKLVLQCIDGAGKVRAVVFKYGDEEIGNTQITIMCEPLRPIAIPSFNDPLIIQNGYDPDTLLMPENFDKALRFVQMLGVKDIAYKLDNSSEDLYEFSNPIFKPKSIRKQTLENELKESRKTIAEKTKKTSRRKEKKTVTETPIQIYSTGTVSGLEDMIRQTSLAQLAPETKPFTLAERPTIEEVIREKITEKEEVAPSSNLAVGIWFKVKGVDFYIATTPGEIPTEVFAINNDSYLELGPESNIFWQHDYYERVMNILIQLTRNLYIYSRLDDPYYFVNAFIAIVPDHTYEISGARRRLPKSEKGNFADIIGAYAKQYPSFFKLHENRIPSLIADSKKTMDGLFQHVKHIQALKLNIIGASGSRIEKDEKDGAGNRIPLTDKKTGAKMIKYYPHVEDESPENIITTEKGFPFVKNQVSLYITDYMIDKIEQLDDLYHRPDYIEEFFVNPSDFTVRGPDQQVFINELDLKDFLDFMDFEKPGTILAAPLSPEIAIIKMPQYLALDDESLYIIQNVLGGNKLRAITVIMQWEESKINLGFYAEEWDGPIPSYADWPYVDLSLNRDGFPGKSLVSSDKFGLLKYKTGEYAALLRISYRGQLESVSVNKGV
jgi:hypothetical protein